jgi:prolipoprotein diacylglyceryltransferase
MRQAPWSYTWSTNTAYTTGYAALAPLAILCLFSLSPLRRKWYEAFYIVHFLAAVFFLWLITNHGKSAHTMGYNHI